MTSSRSHSCAFSSWTHTTSARWRPIHRKKFLRAAERMPLRFNVIILIAHGLPARVHPFHDPAERPAFRRIQNQGGAPVAVFLRCRAVLRRRGAKKARPILRESHPRGG